MSSKEESSHIATALLQLSDCLQVGWVSRIIIDKTLLIGSNYNFIRIHWTITSLLDPNDLPIKLIISYFVELILYLAALILWILDSGIPCALSTIAWSRQVICSSHFDVHKRSGELSNKRYNLVGNVHFTGFVKRPKTFGPKGKSRLLEWLKLSVTRHGAESSVGLLDKPNAIATLLNSLLFFKFHGFLAKLILPNSSKL